MTKKNYWSPHVDLVAGWLVSVLAGFGIYAIIRSTGYNEIVSLLFGIIISVLSSSFMALLLIKGVILDKLLQKDKVEEPYSEYTYGCSGRLPINPIQLKGGRKLKWKNK